MLRVGLNIRLQNGRKGEGEHTETRERKDARAYLFLEARIY